MILDNELVLSDGQLVTASAISTDVYDTGPLASGNTGVALGSGAPLYVFVINNTDLDDTGDDSTATVTFESDSTANLATSATVHVTLGTFAANAAAGQILYGTLPSTTNYERYVGFRFTVAGGNLDGDVSFTAGITRDIDAWIAYASGMNFA